MSIEKHDYSPILDPNWGPSRLSIDRMQYSRTIPDQLTGIALKAEADRQAAKKRRLVGDIMAVLAAEYPQNEALNEQIQAALLRKDVPEVGE